MVTKHQHDKEARGEITDFDYLQNIIIFFFLLDQEPYKSQGIIKHFRWYLVKMKLGGLTIEEYNMDY